MEERGNKTIMCSVLFLDIVEYSKKSVAGQISLKDRFNSYLSEAIRDVPMTDRIILDTGDGAAINFLGDVEDALKAALSLRQSLLNEAPDVDHPLLVRMGINLGPVRLVRDINGQPNIVGDGINVAQRVMGFADVAQILVSRSYYDAVSRLSPQYAGMFHYQGSRTDKHVREHEVYAIGYPGDKTTRRGAAIPPVAEPEVNKWVSAMGRVRTASHLATTRMHAWSDLAIARFREADTRQRGIYAAVVAVPLLLIIALLAIWSVHREVAAKPSAAELAKIAPQPGLADSTATSSPADSRVKTKEAVAAHSPMDSKAQAGKKAESKQAKAAASNKPRTRVQTGSEEKTRVAGNQAKATSQGNNEPGSPYTTSSGSKNSYIVITCMEGTEVFVDGISKGRIDKAPLSIIVQPGKHSLILSNASKGIFTQSVILSPGKSVHIKPNRCN
ncbi:MAG: adenylate/guanylate cyclase domain-containing protein [Gallionella sp.]